MEEMEQGMEQAGYDHDAHMKGMIEGLNMILQSEDINEIKQIAQSLLAQETEEAQVEESAEDKFGKELMQFAGGEQEA